MFLYVLDCPECKQRFDFNKQDEFPENITCPNCQSTKSYTQYSSIVLCDNCHQQLEIPLEIINNPDLSCPACNTAIGADNLLVQEVDTCIGISEELASPRKQLLENGSFLGSYKIISLLGRGGMAEVYLAEHLLLKTDCAIKIMRNKNDDSGMIYIKRFLREAKLSHSFEHQNIVKVFDAGCDSKTGCMFIAMELVKGQNLSELARGRVLSEKALLDILESMAEALKVLNENNIVHRDIKPSNIMRTPEGIYKLMDLGIAKSQTNHQAGEMTLTMDQMTIGTPSYASPEQCQSAHNVDIRSDIYSLGATLYHLASGKVPYDGTTAVEIILKVMKHDIVPLKKIRSDLSVSMVMMIEKMMSLDPTDRPATPEELLDFVRSKNSFFKNFKNIVLPFFKRKSAVRKIAGFTSVLLLAIIVFSCLRTGKDKADNTSDSKEIKTGFVPKDENIAKTENDKPLNENKIVEKRPPLTIEMRLEKTQKRLEEAENAPDDIHKTKRIAFIKKQLEELNRQKRIRQEVLEAKNKVYSKEATQKFVTLLEQYCFALPPKGMVRFSRAWQRSVLHLEKDILKLAEDPSVDPNVYLNNPEDNKRYYIADVLNRRYMRDCLEPLVNKLLAKKMDVNLLDFSVSNNFLPVEIMMFGVEDASTGIPFQMMRTARYRGVRKNMMTIGSEIFLDEPEELLMLAPDIGWLSWRNDTLMHLAARWNCRSFAEKLMYAGFTDYTKKNNDGKTPWDLALERSSHDVIKFLQENNFNTSDGEDQMGQVKLYEAVRKKDYQTVRELISSKQADPSIKSFDELNALDYACSVEDLKMVEVIMSSYGRKFSYENSVHRNNAAQGVYSTHPLQIAVVKKNHKLFEYLLQHGVDSKYMMSNTHSRKLLNVDFILDLHRRRTNSPLEDKYKYLFIKSLVEYDKTYDVNNTVLGRNTLAAVCENKFSNRKYKYDLVKFLMSKGAVLPEGQKNRYLSGGDLVLKDILSGKTDVKIDVEDFKAAPQVEEAKRYSRKSMTTAQERIEWCQARLENVKNSPDNKNKSRMIAFINRQITELQRQKKIREEVLAAKKQQYSKEATQRFIREVEIYCFPPRKGGKLRFPNKSKKEASAHVDKMIKMLADPAVDPNVYLYNPENDEKYFIADAVVSCFTSNDREHFAYALTSKKIDVNLMNLRYSQAWIPIHFLMFGVEDREGDIPFQMFRSLDHRDKSKTILSIGADVSLELLERLLLLAPDPNWISLSENKNFMHLAAMWNNRKFAEKLLYAGFVDYTIKDKYGKTPWDIALERCSFDMIKFMQENNLNTSDGKGQMGQIKLFEAVKNRDYNTICKLIESGEADPSIKFCNELNALEQACAMGDLKMVDVVMSSYKSKFKYDAYAADKRGVYSTHPLTIALIKQNHEMFEYLLQKGIHSKTMLIRFHSKRMTNVEFIIDSHARYLKVPMDDNKRYLFVKSLVELDKTYDINNVINGKNTLSAVCDAKFKNKKVQQKLVSFLLERGAVLPDNQKRKYRSGGDPVIRKMLREKGALN